MSIVKKLHRGEEVAIVEVGSQGEAELRAIGFKDAQEKAELKGKADDKGKK